MYENAGLVAIVMRVGSDGAARKPWLNRCSTEAAKQNCALGSSGCGPPECADARTQGV